MLVTENLILRPLRYGDDDLFFKWRNDLEYMKFTKSFRLPKHQGMEKDWLESAMKDKSNKNIFFIIETVADSTPIGFAQLNQIDWISKNCMFGMAIPEPNLQGKGYGRETTKVLMDYAFDILNLHKIYVEINDFNTNTIRIYTKMGFEQEGLLKEQYFWEGKYHDVGVYALFKRTFKL